MAHIAGEVGTKGGLIAPFVLQISANEAELGYVLRYAELHDPATIALMAKHPSAGHLAWLMRENLSVRTPDLRPFFRRFVLKGGGVSV